VSSQTRAPSRRAKTERDPRFDEALSQALAPAPASSAHRPSPPPPKAAMPSADGRRGDADATHAARGSGVGPNHEAPSHEATSGSATPPPDGEGATTAPSLRNHASDHASDAHGAEGAPAYIDASLMALNASAAGASLASPAPSTGGEPPATAARAGVEERGGARGE